MLKDGWRGRDMFDGPPEVELGRKLWAWRIGGRGTRGPTAPRTACRHSRSRCGSRGSRGPTAPSIGHWRRSWLRDGLKPSPGGSGSGSGGTGRGHRWWSFGRQGRGRWCLGGQRREIIGRETRGLTAGIHAKPRCGWCDRGRSPREARGRRFHTHACDRTYFWNWCRNCMANFTLRPGRSCRTCINLVWTNNNSFRWWHRGRFGCWHCRRGTRGPTAAEAGTWRGRGRGTRGPTANAFAMRCR